jgi:hypothetical protein
MTKKGVRRKTYNNWSPVGAGLEVFSALLWMAGVLAAVAVVMSLLVIGIQDGEEEIGGAGQTQPACCAEEEGG